MLGPYANRNQGITHYALCICLVMVVSPIPKKIFGNFLWPAYTIYIIHLRIVLKNLLLLSKFLVEVIGNICRVKYHIFILTANIKKSGLFLTFDPQILTFQDILEISYFSGQNTSKSWHFLKNQDRGHPVLYTYTDCMCAYTKASTRPRRARLVVLWESPGILQFYN